MKKTNFLSSLAAVLVAGCMFTSCEKDDLNATFEAGPATVTIKTSVVYALTGKSVTGESTISTPASEYEVKGAELFGTYPKGVSAGTVVDINANYKTVATGSTSVTLNPLKAGGTASYPATIVITDGVNLDVESANVGETEVTKYATFTHMSHDTYDGKTWAVNATDYYQPFTVTYTEVVAQTTGSLATTALYNDLDDANKEAVQNIYNGIKNSDKNEETEKSLPGGAGAWSYFTAFATYTKTQVKYTISTKQGIEVASFVVTETSTVADWDEIAHPSHAGHWTEGHGHSGAENAGGGISMAE